MRELLGELLLECGTTASAEYEAALRVAPHRLAALFGVARAADAARGKSYYKQIVEQCSRADGDRSEIENARAQVAQERD